MWLKPEPTLLTESCDSMSCDFSRLRVAVGGEVTVLSHQQRYASSSD